MSEHEIVEWLKERRANCLRISKTKTGADRAGWEEDAEYFRQAVMLILGIKEQDIAETNPPVYPN
jgi:hypothetical protein